MRADRLVTTLLILQARGRITAGELAEELEVSERTARRDLEALAMSGVPIYSQAGRGGGWTLVGGASTDLTGLTADEARALFLTIGTAATATPSLRAAARKLAQALPESFRAEAGRADRAAHVDPARWGRQATRADDDTFLEPIQQAVVAERRIRIGYRAPGRPETVRLADPLGLVAKAGIWYLIANTDRGGRTFRVGRVTSVEVLDEPAPVPDDFDLGQAWREIVVDFRDRNAPLTATGRCESWLLGPLRHVLGSRLTIGPRGPAGDHDIEARGATPTVLAGELAGFADGLVIDGPDEVIAELARLGRRLADRYGEPGDGTDAEVGATGGSGDGDTDSGQNPPGPASVG